ncbi:histidine kinase dimerization/phospho-acceptor domain-containing protein [Leucobacter soli]|uniref:histidine kinase dimerization/phospho-acceptor domain-containing protein n=1 Tax=Leucobacter soli TaxID=2812850 RepID=UPI00360F0D72
MVARNGRSAFRQRLRRLRLRWIRFSQPLLGPLRRRWKRSLKLRTMTITGIVTGVMILIAGTFILTNVGDDLYSARRDQVLQDSARATLAAQGRIDASDASNRASMLALAASVRRTVQDTSASQLIYVRRQPGQAPAPDAPDDSTTLPQLVDAVTPELSEAVKQGEAPQFWQAVRLMDDSGVENPGIVVASTLSFPAGAGTYDLFIGYDLSDTERALGFISRTLALTALFLMLLIGGLVLVISNIVFRPIRVAANTSRRLAAGDREARMPLQNDEHFDQLSKGFNDMADTLQRRIDELDRLSEMQQRFVSDVSHELRTPLTTVRLASEVLKAQEHDPESSQARAIEVLGDQIDRFESLLTDLLEISRYDAGRVVIETEPTNLVALTNDVVEGLRPLSGSPIEICTDGGFSPLEVDARRIRRIVSNLVGNAIEHGEGRPIVVSVDSNAGAVAIGVRDWGWA